MTRSADSQLAALRACLSAASFWPLDRVGPPDHWLQHAPFAFWLIQMLRPRTLVELGTPGASSSYFVFCQAVERLRLDTRCYGVHARHRVAPEVEAYHDRHYARFSTLLRTTGDDAVRHFVGGTIDLLHIDGRSDEDVRHDFLTWRSRLSARAVVLFHGTSFHEQDFGVARLWNELRRAQPHFEFPHGRGLGVLGVGRDLPPEISGLFHAAEDPGTAADVRSAYFRLGFALSQGSHLEQLSGELRASRTEVAAARRDAARLEAESVALRRRMAKAQAAFEAHLAEAHTGVADVTAQLEEWRRRAHVMQGSLSWRVTEPLRRAAASLRRAARFFRHESGAARPEGGQPLEQPETGSDFLVPYFRSAGFWDPLDTVCRRLREAGWPVYRTLAEAEAHADLIRKSDLFDAEAYAARLGDVEEIDPALHYLIVGEGLGWMPSNRFDPVYYALRYPDLTNAPINRLVHYLSWGVKEDRRPLSVAAGLGYDRSRIDPGRDTVLVFAHEASRTGAPILAYNIARGLARTYNVVAVLLGGGDLWPQFEASCAAAIGSTGFIDWTPLEAEYLVRQLVTVYAPRMAIVNSIECRRMLRPLALNGIPTVTLAHEFASYTRPLGTMGESLDWSTQVVFSAEVVALAALAEHPTLAGRPIHVLRQGRCEVPDVPVTGTPGPDGPELERVFRRLEAERAFVVLGCGFVHLRKGVDLFLSCAAAVAAMGTDRPVRFVWIGRGYDPRHDATYSCYLADQIARSGLEDTVTILEEVADLEPAYDRTHVFFLSSRLDPLPNVTIDAALRGIPVVCFDGATGMAEVLRADPVAGQGVVPHLDAAAAARVIARFADDEAALDEAAAATRRVAQATFDMERYVDRLDELGTEAVRIVRQREHDFATIRDDALFDTRVYLAPAAASDRVPSRDEAIVDFLAHWTAVGLSRRAARNPAFRRPCAGFHPQIYAHEHAGRYDATVVNPFAEFLRQGKPSGPWLAELITPAATTGPTAGGPALRTALHAHFYYPEFVGDLMVKLASNRRPCDLLLSTDTVAKADALRTATASYQKGEVMVRVVPNRGRNVGPLLTAFAEEVSTHYDLIGHFHGKRSLAISTGGLGDRWREFLWQHLLGDRHAMLDVIADRLASDEALGLVFAADPHLSDWDANLEIATDLAKTMGIQEPLPPFFDFPVGGMYWARPEALRPLLQLELDWTDYPEEPAPGDGTILHAIERLLPFVARAAGYRCAATFVPGVSW